MYFAFSCSVPVMHGTLSSLFTQLGIVWREKYILSSVELTSLGSPFFSIPAISLYKSTKNLKNFLHLFPFSYIVSFTFMSRFHETKRCRSSYTLFTLVRIESSCISLNNDDISTYMCLLVYFLGRILAHARYIDHVERGRKAQISSTVENKWNGLWYVFKYVVCNMFKNPSHRYRLQTLMRSAENKLSLHIADNFWIHYSLYWAFLRDLIRWLYVSNFHEVTQSLIVNEHHDMNVTWFKVTKAQLWWCFRNFCLSDAHRKWNWEINTNKSKRTGPFHCIFRKLIKPIRFMAQMVRE